MHNDIDSLVAEAKRDCEMARTFGHGVNLATAGVVSNGSTLEGLRALMHTIQFWGRYQESI